MTATYKSRPLSKKRRFKTQEDDIIDQSRWRIIFAPVHLSTKTKNAATLLNFCIFYCQLSKNKGINTKKVDGNTLLRYLVCCTGAEAKL